MTVKKKIAYPVIVEGKYDKAALKSIFDVTVVALDGFGVFNSKEKQALVRTLARDGIIVLTDSDGAGKLIRSFLSGIIPKDRVYNLYIPKIEGKEKRKTSPSKEGLLGVEGMSREVLEGLFERFVTTDGQACGNAEKDAEIITKVDFYIDKLTGAPNSSERRDLLAARFSLPSGMTPNALLDALNILTDRSGYRAVLEEMDK